MQINTALKSYAELLGLPDSKRLAEILATLFDNDEKLEIAKALPGTVQEISQKTKLPLDRTKDLINELHLAGGIIAKIRNEKTFHFFPGIIELRDAVVLFPDAGKEIIRLFDEIIHEELPEIVVPQMEKMGVPPMLRVIPIEESVESKGEVLDADSARKILKDADQIVAIPCACRKTTRELDRSPDCPAPKDLNMCLMINEFGRESLSRNFGELLTAGEAIKRLEKAEEAGLVHMTRNNIKKDMIMCNCCSCCCTSLFMQNKVGFNSTAPSRFRVKLNEDECTGCEICVDRCQFMAIEVDDIARIDLDKCFGCGVCVPTCPSDALKLEEIRPKAHIRVT